MVNLLYVIIIGPFLWGAINPLPVHGQKAFQKLTQRFEHGAVFHAHFSHHFEDSFTGDQETKSGEIWIAKSKYKIVTGRQRVAVDGILSHVYDSTRNRLIISTYAPEDDDFAPSRILNGVDSTYTIKKQQLIGKYFHITLDSDDPFALFKWVKITLNKKGIPTKIYVKDTVDNLIATTFSNGKFIAKKPSMFELTYPKDAKIIDMRQ